jgi:hypothetical protein
VFVDGRYISPDTWYDEKGCRHELLPEHRRGEPALTAMANALRVGDHLLARLG